MKKKEIKKKIEKLKKIVAENRADIARLEWQMAELEEMLLKKKAEAEAKTEEKRKRLEHLMEIIECNREFIPEAVLKTKYKEAYESILKEIEQLKSELKEGRQNG